MGSLLETCTKLPRGRERKRLAGRAVDLADAQLDDDFSYLVRSAFLLHCYGAPADQSELAVFSWCLAMHDRDPTRFPRRTPFGDLLWKYKWMIDLALDTPSISLEQIDGLIADFERRCALVGQGSQVVAKLTMERALAVEGPEAAGTLLARYLASPRDQLSDCTACDASLEAFVHIGLGDDVAALRTAEPVLTGTMTCPEQPQRMQAALLLSLLRSGRDQDAIDFHLAAYARNQRLGVLRSSVARHVEFLAVTGNVARSLEVIDRFLPMLDLGLARGSGLDLLRAARYLCGRLESSGVDGAVVALPGSVTGQAAATLPPADAGQLLGRAGGELARQFDRRNGNDRQWRWFHDTSDLDALVRDLPIGLV